MKRLAFLAVALGIGLAAGSELGRDSAQAPQVVGAGATAPAVSAAAAPRSGPQNSDWGRWRSALEQHDRPGIDAAALVGPFRVARVVDGDTIVLAGGDRVRLIGVDTPETVHPNQPVEFFGKQASEFTRRTAEGRQVHLEFDQGAGRTDRYGRTLAYVWLADGRLLNVEIIRQGYGHAYTRFPFSRMAEFRAAEREAREAGRGLWNGEPGEAVVLGDVDPSSATAGLGCIPIDQCCRVCSRGQACGASCISRSSTCRKGRGCACNSDEVCH